ncbi:MAG: 30S ribosomal protein S20 [Patescibacteria group bacterium]
MNFELNFVPIKKSAKKYMRVTERKTAKNKIVRGTFRSAIKKTREAVSAGKVEEAREWLKKSIKSLDKAAQKKVIKKNTAARKKSRLNKLVKNLATKK